MRNFADPGVGGVAGNQRYSGAADDSRGERTYWSLDRILKGLETRSGNVISATGALYAVRRELVGLVPPDTTDDFYLSVGVVRAGRRLVFERDAVAFEAPRDDETVEFSRKVRIITRGLTGVIRHRATLDARRYGFYAIQMLTHKVLRRLVFLPIAVIAVVSPRLWHRGLLYRLVCLAQLAVFGAGVTGLVLGRSPIGRRPWFSLPAYFLLVNAASAQAAFNVLRGRSVTLWNPSREGSER
jgi:hypothetical protein